MLDYGYFAYLDLQKTGSTYVSRFLKNCSLCKEKRFVKHDWVRKDYNPHCFYFITIRHPISLYGSLYRFGLDGKGALFYHLRARNKLSAYCSFNSFVEYILIEDNANNLGDGFNSHISKHIGFMSFRFLKLSLSFPMKKIYKCLQQGIRLETLQDQFITNLEIKNENLNQMLLHLSKNLIPQYFNQDKVRQYIKQTPNHNVSSRSEKDIDLSLPEETMQLIKRKEWLLLSRYSH